MHHRKPLIIPFWISRPNLIVTLEKASRETIDEVIEQLFTKDGDVLLKELKLFEDIPSVCYAIARLYAGQYQYNQNNEKTLQPFISLSSQQREVLAIQYAKKAIILNYDESRRFLVTAFMTGAYGCIRGSLSGLEEVYQLLKQSHHLQGIFEFACYKLNRLPVLPYDPLMENILRPVNKSEEAFEDLAQILQGDDLEFILKIIEFLLEQFGKEKLMYFLKEQFNKYHPQWLGLVLAWLHSPQDIFGDQFPLKTRFEFLRNGISINSDDFDDALKYLVITDGDILDDGNQLVLRFKEVLEQCQKRQHNDSYSTHSSSPE